MTEVVEVSASQNWTLGLSSSDVLVDESARSQPRRIRMGISKIKPEL